jgi:hypothetical protein
MVDLSEDEKLFLIKMIEETNGETGAQMSMFDIGGAVGLDHDSAGKIGEELIGWGLVEVRTLSGAIGLTESGIEEGRRLGAGPEGPGGADIRLGAAPVVEDAIRDRVEQLVAGIKGRINELKIDFESMAELTADLRTLDAQLASPRPKTAVIRECFLSAVAVLEKAGPDSGAEQVRGLL